MINWGELDNRLDPSMALYQRKTTLFQYPAIRLSNLLRASPQYGANETGITRHSDDEPRYIRITDIDEYGLLKPEVGKTAEIVNPQYLLTNNDILLARSGATVGKSYIHKTGSISYPCFFAGYMIRFIVDTEKVLPDYVFAFTQLDTYYEWVSAIQRAAGQPNINAEEYKSLKIPVPPMAVQAEIVKRVNSAYATKKIKEAEAQRSLDSIDDYLLNELGINLPKPEANTTQDRIFFRNFSDVSGERFDPNKYRRERLEAISSIKNSIFPIKTLREIVSFRSIKVDKIDGAKTYIGMKNIVSNTGELISTNEKETISSASVFFKGDILFPKLRPYLNKVYYTDEDGFCSTEFHVLHSGSQCNEFIANFLRSKIVLAQTKYLMSGNTLPRLQLEDIETLFIPTPPLEKQLEIVDRITAIRNQAKQLRKEAEAELEQAKQAVEAMILGK